MQRCEEYSILNRRDDVGWLRIPPKLPLLIGGFIVTIYMLNILCKQSRHRTDERVIKVPVAGSEKNNSNALQTEETKRKFNYAHYSDINVSDQFAGIRKWKQRALAAEARLARLHAAKDEADSVRSKPCSNANVTRYLLNATAVLELNDRLLAKWREYDDPLARWMNTVTVFNDVWDEHLRLLKPVPLTNIDEKKYLVDFLKPPKECNIVTLGVGYDNIAESKFLRRHPKCRLLAADPQAERNRELVEGLHGQFVNVAVAGTAGVYTAGVAGVGAKDIDHISFVDFMRRYNGDRVVDWLNMDIEKAELGILQAMHENSTMIPPICQFNVEVHHAPDLEPDGSRSFVDLLEKILRKGHYIPMHVELPNDHIVNDLGLRFLRMFFLNVEDKICVHKFVC